MRTVKLSAERSLLGSPLRALLVLASMALLSCQGQIGDAQTIDRVPGSAVDNNGNPVSSGTSGTSGTTPGGVFVTGANGVAVKGFVLPLQQPQLLPFAVRFARVAAVAGIPATDPALELLRQNRTQLGDHDYANGIKADNTWTALRMSVWVKSLQPVCSSPAMTKQFPALPENLSSFVEAAYGRAAVPQDAADVQDSMTGLTLSAAQRYQTLCLAVLSSMEFLTQ